MTARTSGDNGPDDGYISVALSLEDGERYSNPADCIMECDALSHRLPFFPYRYAYITSMAVPNNMRKQGVGQCLMEGVERASLSFDPPCTHAVLHVFEDNDSAR